MAQVTLAMELLWGEPNSIKRTMRAADFVATAFDAGKLKADKGYGWPVEVEAALNRVPLQNLGECIALIDGDMGNLVPSQVSMIEDVRADLAKRLG